MKLKLQHDMLDRLERAADALLQKHPEANQWAVKCDDCKRTVRYTKNVHESYAGTRCKQCEGA